MVIKEKDFVTPKQGILITYKGKFNMDDLYKKCKPFFDSRKYIFTEKEQTEKTKAYGNEFKIIWEAEREVDDYVKFYIKSTFEGWDLLKKEDNYTGDLKINLIANLILDYRNTFIRFPFLLFIYNNFIIKKKIENVYESKLYHEINEYTDLLKNILNITK